MTTPLYHSISALVLMLDKSPKPDALQLEFIKAHLGEAQDATTNEIEQLAVEGIQETYDDMMSQDEGQNRDALLELLKTSILAYQVQLLKEEQHLWASTPPT
jgi:hypothetical protein